MTATDVWIVNWLVVATALVACFYFYPWLEKRHYFYIAVGTTSLCLYLMALAELLLSNAIEFWKYLGLFLGPTLVAVGWVVTNEINIINSRKQHTVNLLVQYFTNPKRIEDKEGISKHLPGDKKLSNEEFAFAEHSHDALRVAIRELNYLDFLASAIVRRDVDNEFARRVLRDVVLRYHEKFGPYIEFCRVESSDTWEDFVALHERWK